MRQSLLSVPPVLESLEPRLPQYYLWVLAVLLLLSALWVRQALEVRLLLSARLLRLGQSALEALSATPLKKATSHLP
ncbi:MAG: hypothetical protein ACLP2X_13000 [Syntrophobacteraceae bacterium]